MPWRKYRPYTLRGDIEDVMSEMERQFYGLLEGIETAPMLPAKEFRGRMLPALRGDLRVDVREHDDEVIVVADLPGFEKENVSIELLDSKTLKVSVKRDEEQEEKEEGYYMKERMFGSMERIIRLPSDVKDGEASASFKNGVLEVRLKKSVEEPKSVIPID